MVVGAGGCRGVGVTCMSMGLCVHSTYAVHAWYICSTCMVRVTVHARYICSTCPQHGPAVVAPALRSYPLAWSHLCRPDPPPPSDSKGGRRSQDRLGGFDPLHAQSVRGAHGTWYT